MASQDLYRLIDRQTLQSQQVLNVYYYKQISAAGSSELLIAAFIEDVLPAIRAIQVDDLTHVRIDCENLTGVVDYVEETLTSNNTGADNTEPMPTFVAWGFRLNRASRLSRHGYKRIAGPGEANVTSGVPAAGFLGTLNAAAAAIGADIGELSGPSTYRPYIVRATGTAPSVTYTSFEIGSVQLVGISSQVSRKLGRGS